MAVMRKQIWVLAFLAALLADMAGILAGNEWVQWISKPLILPFCSGIFIQK